MKINYLSPSTPPFSSKNAFTSLLKLALLATCLFFAADAQAQNRREEDRKRHEQILLDSYQKNTFFDIPWMVVFNDSKLSFEAVEKLFLEKSAGLDLQKLDRKLFNKWRFYKASKRPMQNADGSFVYADEVLDNLKKKKAAAAQGDQNRLLPANFTFIGQQNSVFSSNNGRIERVNFHPTDPNIVWASAPEGGLWRSNDGGDTWTTQDDFWEHLSVGDLVYDLNNTNIIYVATDDHDSWFNENRGVLRSMDGGATWSIVGLPNSQAQNIYKLMLHPDGSTLFACTNEGLFKSTDQGVTWTKNAALPATAEVNDLEFQPTNSQVMFVSLRGGGSPNFNYFYVSTDGGATFSLVAAPMNSKGRTTQVCVSPDDPDVAFIGIYPEPPNYTTTGGMVMKYVHSTSTLTVVTEPTYQFPNIWVGGAWDFRIELDPTNADHLIYGSVFTYESFNAGATWTYIPSLHADIHDIKWQPNSNKLWFADDGGLGFSTNAGATWTTIENLPVMQFYSVRSSKNGQSKIMGAQDAGVHLDAGGSWFNPIGGDGLEVAIDPVDESSRFYGSIQNGLTMERVKYQAGATTSFQIMNQEIGGGEATWRQKIVIDPTDRNTIFTNYFDVLKSTDGGASWTNLTNGTLGNGTSALEYLVQSKSNPLVMVTGLGLDDMWRTTNGGATWTAITHPGIWVGNQNTLVISPTDPNKMWVAGWSQVKKTTDGGATWTSFQGSLPYEAGVGSIAYQEGTADGLYVAGILGEVYYRDDNTGDWVAHRTNLPNVRVQEVEVLPHVGKVRVATWGRGVWESPVHTASTGLCIEPAPPAISSTFCGSSATLTVAAAPSGYSIIWDKNGTTLAGETATTLAVSVSGKYRARYLKNASTTCHSYFSETQVIEFRATPAVLSGNGLHFDGSDDYVNFSSEFDLIEKSFTVEFWAKRESAGSHDFVASMGLPWHPTNKMLHIGFRSNNQFTFAFNGNDLNAASGFSDLAWHHWACVYDKSIASPAHNRFIYRDGILVASDRSTSDFLGLGKLNLGRAFDSHYFPGNLDELKIWSVARTQAQVVSGMFCAPDCYPQSLEIYLPMNDGTAGGNNSALAGLTDFSSHACQSSFENFNLNGSTSNVSAGVQVNYFADADGDGFGNAAAPLTGCPTGAVVSNSTDCNDSNASVNPAASEVCANSLDDDCDGATDSETNRTLHFAGSGHQMDLPTVAHSQYFTVEAWIQTSVAGWNPIVEWTGATNSIFGISGSSFIAYYENGGGVHNTPNLADGNWHHVALVHDGYSGSNNIRAYVDGVLRLTHTTTNVISNTGTVVGAGFNGNLDDLRFWNVALTEAQIQARMNIRLDGNESNLIRYYPMDQGKAGLSNAGLTSVKDKTSNAAHGTAVGFAMSGATSNWVNSRTYPTRYKDNDGDGFGGSTTWTCGGMNVGYFDATTDCNDSNAAANPAAAEVCGNLLDDDCNGQTDEKTLSLHFDGGADSVRLSNTLGNFGTSNFSIELKIKTTATSKKILGKRPVCNCATFWNLNITSAGKLEMEMMQATTTGSCSGLTYFTPPVSNQAVNDGVWHHVAIVREGTTMRIYVDGVLDVSNGYAPYNFNNSHFLLLGNSICSGNGFVGEMDEVRFWNHARTTAQVNFYKNTSLTGSETGLLAYYDFNNQNANPGGSNAGVTSLADRSGNGHTGTLHNFALTGTTGNWLGNPTNVSTLYADADGDGFGNPLSSISGCSQAGYVSNSSDCDDTKILVNPNGTETCNGFDDDCDGSTDEGVQTQYFADSDGDGFGNSAVSQMACSQPTGYVLNSTDCDDADAARFPGNSEICDGKDNDCQNGVPANEVDGDGDGSRICQNDCDDADAARFPGNPEICDGKDNDCQNGVPANEVDGDGDGFRICQNDCNDGNNLIHPNANEICNFLDDDCDTQTDEGFAIQQYFEDADGDGFGNAGVWQMVCAQPSGYVSNSTDCADADAAIFPGNAEICDGKDNDCQDGIPANEMDGDGDGFRICQNDCDDNNNQIHPNANEVCNNSLDDDCDGSTDENCGQQPEMNVQGNSQSIADGDNSPTTDDHTNFGNCYITGQTVVRTFTIQNSGLGDLTLTGASLSGAGAAHFSLQNLTYPIVVAPNGSASLSVTYDPSTVATHLATLSIDNDDTDENPYNFDLQGTGIACSPTVPSGTVFRWTNAGGDGLWSNANNWLNGSNQTGVPTAGSTAFFSCLGGEATLDISPNIGSLVMDASFSSVLHLGSQTLTLTSALTVPSASQLDAGTSLVKFNGHVATNCAAEIFNLEILGNGNITTTQDLNISNNLTLTLVSGIGNLGGGQLKVKGNVVSNDSDGWGEGGFGIWAFVRLVGSTDQTISGTGKWSRLDIQKTGGNVLMPSNLDLTSGGTLMGNSTADLLNTGGIFRANGHATFNFAGDVDDVELLGNGNITTSQDLNISNTLTLTSVSGIGNQGGGHLKVKGNVVSNDTDGWGEGGFGIWAFVRLVGSTDQTISGTGKWSRLDIQKTGGNVLMPVHLNLTSGGTLMGNSTADLLNTGGIFRANGHATFNFAGDVDDVELLGNGNITTSQDLNISNTLTLTLVSGIGNLGGGQLKVKGNVVSNDTDGWGEGGFGVWAFVRLVGNTDQTISGTGKWSRLDIQKTGGNVLMPSNLDLTSGGTLMGNSTADLLNTGGIFKANGHATFNFAGDVDDVEILGGGNITTSQDLNISNTLTLTSVSGIGNQGGGHLKVKGNVVSNDTDGWGEGGFGVWAFVRLVGSTDQTISGTGKWSRLDIQKTGGNVLMPSNLDLTSGGTLMGNATADLLNTGGIFKANGHATFNFAGDVDDVEILGNGNITTSQDLNISNTLTLTSVNGIGNLGGGHLKVKGNVVSNDSDGWGEGGFGVWAFVRLVGSTDQTISGTGKWSRLDIQKTGGNVLMPVHLNLTSGGTLMGNSTADLLNTGGIFRANGHATFNFAGDVDDVEILGGGNITTSQDLNISNTLTLTSVSGIGNQGGGQLKVKGNVVSNDTDGWGEGGFGIWAFVRLVGSTDQTISGTGKWSRLDIQKTGGNVLMPSNLDLTSGGTLMGNSTADLLNTGGIFRANGHATFNFAGDVDDVEILGGGNITTSQDLNISNTLTLTSVSGIGNLGGGHLKVKGNVVSNDANGWGEGGFGIWAYVRLVGTGDQTISGTGVLSRLEFAKPSGNALFDAAFNKTFNNFNITAGTWNTFAQTFTSSGGFSATGGQIGGSGTLVGNVTCGTGGGIAPGSSPGCLTVTGNVVFGSGSAYRVDIAGNSTACTDFDKLTVSGTISYGGTLFPTFTYAPAAGHSYQIAAVTGSKSGNFSAITIVPSPGITATFTPSTGILSVSASSVSIWFADADGDGFGNSAVSQLAGTQPTNFVSNSTDCNDASAAINPNATDNPCNNLDEDCSGTAAADVTAPTFSCPTPTVVAGANCTFTATWTATATDNCTASPTITGSHASGDVFPNGNTTVTLQATDAAGNSTTCTFVVAVAGDNVPPTVTCPAANTVDCTVSDLNQILGGTATATDNCATPTVSHNAPATFPTGNTTVTWTANDGNGNTATCTQSITVADNQAPTIACPANKIVAVGANCSATLGSHVLASKMDNCSPGGGAPVLSFVGGSCGAVDVAISGAGIPAVNQTFPIFSGGQLYQDCYQYYGTGGYGIWKENGKWRIQGGCGIVYHNDDISSCPCPPTTGWYAFGCGVATGISESQSPASSTVLTGHNTVQIVTLTATDGGSNTATCTFTVTLKDQTAPTITCAAPVSVNNTPNLCTGTATLTAPTVSDNCMATFTTNGLDFDGQNDYVTRAATGFPTGNNDHTVEFWVNYKGGQTSHRWILWHGTIAANSMVTYGFGGSENNQIRVHHVSAGNDKLSNVVLPTNTWTHLAFVYRGSSNQTDIYKNGVFQETLTFSASLNLGTTTFQLGTFNGTANTFAAKVILDEVRIWNSARTAAQILANKDSEISNTAGMAAYLKLNEGTAGGTNTGLNAAVGTVGANATLVNFALSGTTSNWVGGAVSGQSLTTSNNAPATFPIGSTTVVWTANDGNGNTSTCSQTVTVVDNQAPTIACPANINLIAGGGNCTAVATWSSPTASDNCTNPPTLTGSHASGNTFSAGNTTVTLQATDGANNSSTCTFVVSVVDNIAPTITCPANSVVSTGSANCSSTLGTWSAASSSDNCASPTVSQSPAAATVLSGIGASQIVTLTATDAASNSATCTFTVTLQDQTAPTLTCPPNATVVNPIGACTFPTSNLPKPSATDNCTTFAAATSNGLHFDGVNDFVETSPLTLGAGNFTIEFWVKANSIGTYPIFFAQDQSGIGTPSFRFEVTTDGTNRMLFAMSSTGASVGYYTTGTFSANVWTHLAIVRNGNNYTTFKDGVAIGSGTSSGNVNLNSNIFNFRIGARRNGANTAQNPLNGTFDEFRIWTVAKTAAQLSTNMNSELFGNETGLLHYYKFNEGTAGGNNAGLNSATATAGQNATLNNFALNGATSNWVAGKVNTAGLATATHNAPASLAIGTTTTVTWSVADNASNIGTCQQTITVTGRPEICNGVDDNCDGLVDENNNLATNFSVTNVTCNGNTNGTVFSGITGGTSPYSYLWSNAKTTANINLLAAGTYSVTVTDAGSCTKTGSATVTQPTAIVMTVAATPTTATITASGGTPGYTYNRTGATTFQPNPVFVGLTPNTSYVFKTKDANGCQKSVIKKTPATMAPNGGGSAGQVFEKAKIGGNSEPLQFVLFPNPADKLLNIGFAGDEPVAGRVEIFNQIGQRVLTQNLSIEAGEEGSLSIGHLPEGSYFLVFKLDGGTATSERFVIFRD